MPLQFVLTICEELGIFVRDEDADAVVVYDAGGKFDGGAYKVSGGLHGVGVSVVNALSDWLEITICRNGESRSQRFEKGIPVTDLSEGIPTERTGTKVHFLADATIFEEVKYSFDVLGARFREMAFLNPGLSITLDDKREGGRVKEYRYEGPEIIYTFWAKHGPCQVTGCGHDGVSSLADQADLVSGGIAAEQARKDDDPGQDQDREDRRDDVGLGPAPLEQFAAGDEADCLERVHATASRNRSVREGVV